MHTMNNDLQTVLASISQGVYLLGEDGRMRLYNQRLCELLDIPASFFDQHPTLAELNAYQMQRGDFGDNASLVDAHARNYVLADGQTPTPAHFLRMTRTGHTLEIRSSVLPDGSMVRTFADVSDYVQAEAARERANQLLLATQEIAQVGGWEIDLPARRVTWTEGVYRIFDTSPAQFTPTLESTRALFTDAAWQVVSDSYQGGDNPPEQHCFEIEMLTVTGRPIWVLSKGHTTWKNGKAVSRTAIVQDTTERKSTEALIWAQAHFDPLTGLPNRRMLRERLEQELKKCRRDSTRLAVLFVDLDHFKEVNDSLGHDQGDLLLIEAARRIAECLREVDTVARMGGDEFTVLVTELHATDPIESILRKILEALSSAFSLAHDQVFVSASIGVTVYPDDAMGIDDLLKQADQALYVAKNAGRNRYHFFTPALQEATQRRAQITHDLRLALAERQFRVFFQPIVELASGIVSKAEALVRWQHPERGVVSPAEFIPVAESSGLIVPLGEWVFQQAAHQARRWRETLHPHFQISVNKSPAQFENPNAENRPWIDQLTALGLDGASIVVEITEGLLLSTSDSVIEQLLRLRDDGIQVSLDDFGTGYSSLAYLQKFDIDFIKIDQSFVRQLVVGSTDLALCRAIIVMAHTLGMKVIAEGIETAQQRDLLAQAGCDYGQGYLFSRPVPASDFERLFDRPFAGSGYGDLDG